MHCFSVSFRKQNYESTITGHSHSFLKLKIKLQSQKRNAAAQSESLNEFQRVKLFDWGTAQYIVYAIYLHTLAQRFFAFFPNNENSTELTEMFNRTLQKLKCL